MPPLIALTILFVFLPALEASFVFWDDHDLLQKTTRYKDLTWPNLKWMFSTTYAGHFEPLTWLSFTLDEALSDCSDFGLHFTSVLLHGMTAIAFYFVTRRLLVITFRAGPNERSAPVVAAAWIATMLFAVHPLRAESVAWLAERRDVLGGFLFVMAVWAYLKYAESIASTNANDRPAVPIAWYAGMLILAILSLLAKATAVTLPAVMLILDVYPLRRLGVGQHGPGRRRNLVWVEKLPLIALAVFGSIKAIAAQQDAGAMYSLAQHDLVSRLAQMVYGLSFYITKTIYPAGLGPFYELPSRATLLGPILWKSLVVCLPILIAAIWFRRKLPGVAAALAIYVVVLAPVLGIFQSGPQLVADRYSYLSCMVFAVLCGWGLLRLYGYWVREKVANYRAYLAVLTVAPVVLLGVLTQQQTRIWINDATLWSWAIQMNPGSGIVNVNYADALARGAPSPKYYAVAIKHYERGLEINPADPVAWHHLGDVHRMTHKPAEAIRCYLRALAIDPSRRNACFRLASIFRATGHPHEAVQVLRDAVRHHPEDIELMTNLADLLSTHPDPEVRDGELAVAVALIASRQTQHHDPRTLIILAAAFSEVGRFDDAVEAGQRAVDIAESKQKEAMLRGLKRRLALFQAKKPLRKER